MTTERHQIEVRGIPVEIVRKNIKNLHLGVYPPKGRVRVAVPLYLDDEAVRLAVISRLGWIHRKQEGFKKQARQTEREMVSGESHYVWGKRYRLDVIELDKQNSIDIINNSILQLKIRQGTGKQKRQALLSRWYRRLLQKRIPKIIAKWEKIINVKVTEFRIKRMKTLWGTCSVDAGRIWLNLELAKKSPIFLEYIIVHEMVHFLERHHNDNYKNYMDQFMPQWRLYRDELNRTPLPCENWDNK